MSLRDLLPERPVEDVLAGRLRLSLGGQEFVLPVLTIAANEAWQKTCAETIGGLFEHLDAADGPGALIGALSGLTDKQLLLLRAYDTSGLLPDDEWFRGHADDGQLLHAVLACWGAAYPLVVTAARLLAGQPDLVRHLAPSPPMSTPPPAMGGRRSKSAGS